MRLVCRGCLAGWLDGFQFAGNAFQVKDKDNEIRKYKQLHDMLTKSCQGAQHRRFKDAADAKIFPYLLRSSGSQMCGDDGC